MRCSGCWPWAASRKRNRTLKLYQQASPYLAAVLLILLLVIGLTLSANVRHEKASLARLEANHKSKETELRNLVVSPSHLSTPTPPPLIHQHARACSLTKASCCLWEHHLSEKTAFTVTKHYKSHNNQGSADVHLGKACSYKASW